MVYLFSRTNIPKNKTIKHNSCVATGLEPSLYYFHIAKYSIHIMHLYIVYPLTFVSV